MSYTDLAKSLVTTLKESPELTAAFWNQMWREILRHSPRELETWTDIEDDTEDIRADGIETMTRTQMRKKLEENGWAAEYITEDIMKVVAIDDSYRASMLVDVSNMKLLRPCEVPSFADKCADEEYWDDGRFTWKAIQEFAPTWAAAGLVAITQDSEMISFPLPEPAGGRRKRGRTARRRAAKRNQTRKHRA